MTTRKYKKLLMSCGVERNLAEECRKHYAFIRSVNPFLARKVADEYKEMAESQICSCSGAIRVRKKKIKNLCKALLAV